MKKKRKAKEIWVWTLPSGQLLQVFHENNLHSRMSYEGVYEGKPVKFREVM